MKKDLIKLKKHELRENYEKACEKFIEKQIENLGKKVKFDRNSLLLGFRRAIRKIYLDMEEEKKLLSKKIQEFEKENEGELESIEEELAKKCKREDFIDLYEKNCYEFACKEIGIWKIYGYIPDKDYLSWAFENALGKFWSVNKIEKNNKNY